MRPRIQAGFALLLALALLLAGQAAADATAPTAPNGALTGTAMGRAGFAYLTGLRQFGAALLWNRLEPQMHEYYGEKGLGQLGWMLPSIKAVVTLDPQFVQAYYVAPGILIDSGTVAGVSARDAAARAKVGLELAAEGARNNPRSGLLLVSYAQLLFAANKDDARALQFAKSALAPGVIWRNDEEQWNMYAQVRGILRFHGLTQGAAQVQAAMDAISANPHATTETVTPE